MQFSFTFASSVHKDACSTEGSPTRSDGVSKSVNSFNNGKQVTVEEEVQYPGTHRT
jgi:hypothetical protein